MAQLTLLLMPVFGITWVFGAFTVDNNLVVFQYIFTILNSFQGVFLFVCYCLLNNDMKREFRRIKRQSTYLSKSTPATDTFQMSRLSSSLESVKKRKLSQLSQKSKQRESKIFYIDSDRE